MNAQSLLPYLAALASVFIHISSYAQSPKQVFSTFLGGSDKDGLFQKIVVDRQHNIYAMGLTESLDFPVTPDAYKQHLSNSQNLFVTKLDPSGSSIIYSTYLDGSGRESPNIGFQVDEEGNAYISGTTSSPGYPRTPGSYFSTVHFDPQEFFNRIYLTKLNSSGSKLVYSIVFGDINNVQNMSSNFLGLDGEGHAYVTGYSPFCEIETTPGALQIQPPDSTDSVFSKPFICKFSKDGSRLEYATYFGGPTFGPRIRDFTVDRKGNAYLVGGVVSDDFPITQKLFTPNRPYAFLSKINPSGTGLVYSVTIPIGGLHLAVDDSENVYLRSEGTRIEFPVTPGAYDSVNVVGPGFCKFSSSMDHLIFSTRMFHFSQLFGVDSLGRVYMAGSSDGKDYLPISPGAYKEKFNGGKSDIYFCVFDAAGSKLLYATYFGGSGDDYCTDFKVSGSGDVYLTGYTTSPDFPTTEGALSRTLKGSSDSFICKFSFGSTPTRVEETPIAFHLAPAHPNPFNPSTTLSFTLPSPARAELAVYSVTGQWVRTLLDGTVSAGSHSVVWDGRDDSGKPVSSGVYLSRLTTGKRTATGKMVLVR